MKFKDILLIEGRVEDAKKKYPDVPDHVWDVFIQNDPSGNNKYLDWLGKLWKRELNFKKSEDEDINYAKQIILTVKSFDELSDILTPENSKKIIQNFINRHQPGTDIKIYNKIIKNPKDINSYLNTNELSVVIDFGRKLKQQKDDERKIKKDVEKIYEDDNVLIVLPKTQEASCIYGANTRWCTAAKQSENQFKKYTKNNYLIYVIFKNRNDKFKKIAILINKNNNSEIWFFDDTDRTHSKIPEVDTYLNTIKLWLEENQNKLPIDLQDHRMRELYSRLGDENLNNYRLVKSNTNGLIVQHLNDFYLIIDGRKYNKLKDEYDNNKVRDMIKGVNLTPEMIGELFNIDPYDPALYEIYDYKRNVKNYLQSENNEDELIDFVIQTKLYQKPPEGFDLQTWKEINQIETEVEELVFNNEEHLNNITSFESEIEYLKFNLSEYKKEYSNSEIEMRDLEHIENSVNSLKTEIETYEKNIELEENQIEENNLRIRQLKHLKHKIKTKNKGEVYSEEQIDEMFEIIDDLEFELSDTVFLKMLINAGSDEIKQYLNINYIVEALSENDSFYGYDYMGEIIENYFPEVSIVDIISESYDIIIKVNYNQSLNEARLKQKLKPIEGNYARALAEHLGITPYILKLQSWDMSGLEVYETPTGAEFAIGTDDEAEAAFNEYQQNFIEENGINGFSEWFQEDIIHNYLDQEHFKDMLRENYELYVYYIENEQAWGDEDKYQNRLEQEMDEANIIDVDDEDYDGDYEDKKEEFIDYLIDKAGDPVEYYIDNFGEGWMTEYLRNNCYLLDVDGIIESIKNTDGRGNSLSSYDGNEDFIEFDGEDYYIYRIN